MSPSIPIIYIPLIIVIGFNYYTLNIKILGNLITKSLINYLRIKIENEFVNFIDYLINPEKLDNLLTKLNVKRESEVLILCLKTNKLSSQMEIKILLEEKTLLSTKYIKLIGKQDFDRIVIKNSDIKFLDLQCGIILSKDLIIKISFKNYERDYLFNVSDILIKTREIVLTGILDDPLYQYDQGNIDNFKLLTYKREKIRWYELNDRQKYYYLRGCCLLNGVKETIDNMNPVIIIDLSKAKTDLDVYYEIGKAFFKSYGYFGTELDSFVDCLISINISIKDREKTPILRIKGYKNFEENFSGNILLDIFYEKFTNIGFKIENRSF
nr:hypothetical protein [uncultured Chryseobacterium sp.]